MAKLKVYDYRQRIFLPVSLEDQLMPETLEFAIHTLAETRLDTSVFAEKYRNDETGRRAYDPKILLKVVLLGYARGLISSRKIEQACRENVVFIPLACGQQPSGGRLRPICPNRRCKWGCRAPGQPPWKNKPPPPRGSLTSHAWESPPFSAEV
jgi:hypothetical protein